MSLYNARCSCIGGYDQQAEAAVAQDENDKNDESGVLPFTTKREFGNWHWNKEDACQFAKKRYTMASVWFEPGKVYSTYGLEDALAWFQTQDLRKSLVVSEIDENSYVNQSGKFELSMAETCEYYEKICREFCLMSPMEIQSASIANQRERRFYRH
ncbi:MAG: hypothetical protein ACLTDG_12605 [Lachnospiraceae bacterium]